MGGLPSHIFSVSPWPLTFRSPSGITPTCSVFSSRPELSSHILIPQNPRIHYCNPNGLEHEECSMKRIGVFAAAFGNTHISAATPTPDHPQACIVSVCSDNWLVPIHGPGWKAPSAVVIGNSRFLECRDIKLPCPMRAFKKAH